jgi:hypothetical protein
MKWHDHEGTTAGPDERTVQSCWRSVPVGALMFTLTLFLLPGLAVCADAPAEAVAQDTPQPVADITTAARSMEEQLGVHIRGVRLSAAGFMLDLRYRVLDAAKAAPLLNRKLAPYLLASTGARLGVAASPKIGPLRSTQRGATHLDRDYSMLFGNPGRYLRPGSKITLVIGEQKIENLTVE